MPAIDTTRDFKDLPEGSSQYTGASGDGNDPSTADLKAGYCACDVAPTSALETLLGDNAVGGTLVRGGFLGRAHGWER